jgi:hypothetical protein
MNSDKVIVAENLPCRLAAVFVVLAREMAGAALVDARCGSKKLSRKEGGGLCAIRWSPLARRR